MSPPGTHFTSESTEAMWINGLAHGHNILMPGFELSTFVSRNRHSNHMTKKNIPYEVYLALPKNLARNIAFSLNKLLKNVYYDNFHVNYNEDKLRRT